MSVMKNGLCALPGIDSRRGTTVPLSLSLQRLALDCAYGDSGVHDASRLTVACCVPANAALAAGWRGGFVLLSRRWGVERSFGWAARFIKSITYVL